MKRYIVILAVIGVAVFSGLIYGVNMILNQKEAVKIEYEVLEGNPAEAEGISFHVRNQWSGKLHWDSQVTLGEGGKVVKAVTELEDRFDDPTEEAYFPYNRFYEKVNMHLEYNGLAVEDTWIHASGCDMEVCREMLEDCAAETKPGETKTKTVPLKEYQAYYDLYLLLNLDSGSYYVVGNEWEMVDKWIQIKIPDSHQMEVTVQKDAQGKIIMQRCDCAYGLQTLECSSVQTADDVYFVFYGVDTEGQPYDLSLERGNGIFCIPLTPVEEESKSVYSGATVVNYDGAKKVFTLPEEGCCPLELIADEEEQVLYLLTKEQEKAVLRIIDIKTMEEKQKLELIECPYYWNEQQIDVLEDGLVVLLGDNSFCYLEEHNGVYEKKIAVNLGEGPQPSDGKYDYDLIYQDGKAAMVIAEYGNGSTEAYVYVLSENAVEYKAHFMPSFAYEQYYGGSEWIHLRREEPLEIMVE